MKAGTALIPLVRWRKKWLWLAALLPLLFVSDILYGAMEYYGIELPITPGIVLRGLVLCAACYAILKHHPLIDKRLMLWISLLVIGVVPSIVVGVSRGESLFFDISALSKVLYLPLVTGLFVVFMQRYRIESSDVVRFIEYAAYMLGIALLGSQVIGMERQTYGDYAFGSTGIFYAQNDMTLALGLALLAGGYRLVTEGFSAIRLILVALTAFASVQIGTRASLGVVVATAITAVACILWGQEHRQRRTFIGNMKKWLIGFLVLTAMAGMLLYGLTKQQEYSFQQEKLAQVAAGDFPRLLLVLAGARHIVDRPKWVHVLGEGADAFQRGVAQHFETEEDRRVVEVDWMDIFGGYGIAFTLLIHAFVLLVLLHAAGRFIIRRDAAHGLIAAATTLYLGHSALAGHALTSPIPSTLMAAYFSCYFTAQSRRAEYLRSRQVYQ